MYLEVASVHTIASMLRGSNISFTSHTQWGKPPVIRESTIYLFFLDVVEHIFTRIKMFYKTHIDCCFNANI